MAVEVTVLRVFTDHHGKLGNLLGIADAAMVDPRDRQRIATQLGYPETVFIDVPAPGANTAHARIFTPATELPFAGHPTVGASWWLRDRGIAIRALQVPAGIVPVTYEGQSTCVSSRAEWAPEFAIYHLDSPEAVLAADPADYSDDVPHYLWAWTDQSEGEIRSRMFGAALGVPEDEATGSAAVRITDQLGRDLRIVQGEGSVLYTQWNADGWVRLVLQP